MPTKVSLPSKHLHLGIRIGGRNESWTDPEPYLNGQLSGNTKSTINESDGELAGTDCDRNKTGEFTRDDKDELDFRSAMKKTILLLLLALAAVPSFAQRDVKTLNRKTPAQVIAILGQQPCKNQHPAYWSEYDFPDLAHMEFDNNETVIEVFIDDGDEHVFIDRFSTTTNKYCFLSDYVPGGFKVGDTLQKIQSFDFAKSKYGRNNPKNALHLGQDPKWYIAFQEEGYRLSFRVIDNVVVEIWLQSREVAEGYENKYDPFE